MYTAILSTQTAVVARVQAETIPEVLLMLGGLASPPSSSSPRRHRIPLRGRRHIAAGVRGYWASMTKRERREEMQRRLEAR